MSDSLAGRLVVLREEARAGLGKARADVERAHDALITKRQALGTACAIALDVGIDAEEVAKITALSAGTVRKYAAEAIDRPAEKPAEEGESA